jgi:hypothetical protein
MKTAQKLLYVAALLLAFAGCTDPMDEITQTDYPRVFSPVEVTVTHVRFDSAVVEWNSIDDANTYVVELSEQGDTLFSNAPTKRWENVEGTTLSVDSLWGEAQYGLRIKALAFGQGQEESKWKNHVWKTPAEQVFLTLRNQDIKGTSITVRWSIPNGSLTELKVANGPTIALTADKLPSGEHKLEGLNPNTAYTIALFDGTKKRGELLPTTKWKPNGEPNVVMVTAADDLKAICADVANIGKIIYLAEGTYTGENKFLEIPGAMSFVGDPDAATKPKIKFSGDGGAKCITLPAGASLLSFANIEFEGDAATGNSIIDVSDDPALTEGIDTLMFDNCDLSNCGRSFIRLRGPNDAASKPIKLLRVNNCLFKNFGGTNANALIDIRPTAGGIDNISIANSTIMAQTRDFIDASGVGTEPNIYNPVKKISVENCTFDDIMKQSVDSRYIIKAGGNTGLEATIKSCILGKTTDARHYSAGTGSTVIATDCYKTSDHAVTTSNAFTSGVAEYSGASIDLWTNPAAGDFTIKDAAFEGKSTAGDPRWR